MHTTEAWVLHVGAGSVHDREPGELRREAFSFPEIGADEALIEPIYGSWEANMTHALARSPVDVCRQRGEERIVLGNAGVVRILQVGEAVTNLASDDVCVFFGTGRYDAFGYMELAHGYDAPQTVGLLAKRTKVRAKNLLPIPRGSRFSYEQWAAFSLRYMTAWSNWRVAFGCLRLQLTEEDLSRPFVWGWGGGTTMAELDLARRFGCATTMITGNDAHRAEIAAAGVDTLDRRQFPALHFDEERHARDPEYRKAYRDSERRFLNAVKERTDGMGVSIFVDYIGTPVHRPTLRALGRQGVLATAGWKCGAEMSMMRAVQCIKRHTFVHTHYARLSEAPVAMRYADTNGWMPKASAPYSWDDVPTLARDHAASRTESYFPLFAVNPR